MFLSADVISLLLYCAQQLGVTLGVGAQTIMLVAYVSAMRDGVVDSKEAQFARAVRAVLNTGLVLIVLSGIGITVMHIMAGQAATTLSAAYLFKWLLVLLALIFTFSKNLPQQIMQGLAGGSWYALFVVHILAPVTTWVNLLTLYAVWMAGFFICWMVIVYSTKGKPGTTPTAPAQTSAKPAAPARVFAPPPAFIPKPAAPAGPAPTAIAPPVVAVTPPPKPVTPAPLPPKAVAPVAPVPQQAHILQTLPQPEAGQKQTAVVKEAQNPWLPAIKIMPQTPVDVQKQNPDATVAPAK